MSLASNTRWIALSQISRIASQLISLTVLTRLLSPDVYGLMAMALVITNLAYLFKDMGTGSAIIQTKLIDQKLINSVYWMNIGIGVFLFITIYIIASPVADFYHQPELNNILHWLAFIFPVTSFSITHQALLERESKFSIVAMAEVIGVCFGLTIAIISAYHGYGVMSLVFQMCISTIITSVIVVILSKTKIGLEFDKSALSGIIKFSSNLSIFNILLYITRNADSIVIGRLLGSIQLGIYSMGYRLMLFPVQNMTWVASRALYPVISRHQDDLKKVCEFYLKTLGTVSFITAPIMVGLFVLKEPFISVLFGHKWAAIPSILAWLAPVGYIQSIVSTMGSVFLALGFARLMAKIGLISTIVHLIAFVCGGLYNIQTVAQFYLIANIINLIVNVYFCARCMKVSIMILFNSVYKSMLNSFIMGVACYFINYEINQLYQNAMSEALIISIIISAIVYALLSYFIDRKQLILTLSFFKK